MRQSVRERLWAAATSSRDHMLHSNAARWEVFTKASVVRESTFTANQSMLVTYSEETGVAVRCSDRGESGFAAASGLHTEAARAAAEQARLAARPTAVDPLPPPRLLAIAQAPEEHHLPPPEWIPEVVQSFDQALNRCAKGRLELRRIVVQEGSFSWLLHTSDDFVAAFASTTTGLLTEVCLSGEGRGVWREWLHVPQPENFDPELAAYQIGDRGLLSTSPPAQRSGSWDALLHSEVVAAVVAALVPLFNACPLELDQLPSILNRDGLLTSPQLSIVDDRTTRGLPWEGPCDGEGLPAARTLLVDQGVPRHRLACYRDAQLFGEMPRGGAIRLSYRVPPRSGAANIHVLSSEAMTPGDLLSAAPRCIYLLRPLAPIRFDVRDQSYRLVASGVWIEDGAIRGWQPVVELQGGIGQLLRRIDGVANDTRWYQTSAGFVGAPTLLVRRQNVEG